MRIQVEGGQSLSGTYTPSGSVNTAIMLLAVSLLGGTASTLRNVPRTRVVTALTAVAERLGAELHWADDVLTVEGPTLNRRTLTIEDTQASIGSVLFLAPLLVQRRHARLEHDFPLNRIRTHLEALRDLGQDVVNLEGAVECKVNPWEQRTILLEQTSVTATALVMMLAACVGRHTTIYNAACEPQIRMLAQCLNQMGAQVDGVGSNLVTVKGAQALQGMQATIPADHIEAASIAALGALTGGRIEIAQTPTHDLRMIRKVYRRLGISLDLDETSVFVPKHDDVIISSQEEDVDSSIETAPWPGFPSDLVGVATVIATQARGTSLIHEKLFSNRLLFVDKLKAMGAQIVLCDPHRAIVVGRTPLHGIYMDAPDIRTGFGLISAALVAEGVSTIDNAQGLEQWFVGAFDKLRALSARITIG